MIMGSPISQNWGKNQKKEKNSATNGMKKNAKKEISLLFTDTHLFLTDNLFILFSRSFFGSTMGTKRMGRKREKIIQVTKSLFLTPVVLHMYVCMCVKCV